MFTIYFSDGSKISGLVGPLHASAWYLLWTSLGVDKAYELIDSVAYIVYCGS